MPAPHQNLTRTVSRSTTASRPTRQLAPCRPRASRRRGSKRTPDERTARTDSSTTSSSGRASRTRSRSPAPHTTTTSRSPRAHQPHAPRSDTGARPAHHAKVEPKRVRQHAAPSEPVELPDRRLIPRLVHLDASHPLPPPRIPHGIVQNVETQRRSARRCTTSSETHSSPRAATPFDVRHGTNKPHRRRTRPPDGRLPGSGGPTARRVNSAGGGLIVYARPERGMGAGPASAAAPRSEPARSYASNISITSSGFFIPVPPSVSMTRRGGLPGAQDRTGGELRGRPWGEIAAASGDFRWPPTGRISWPPTLAPDGDPNGSRR
jgi:hypothetical protein